MPEVTFHIRWPDGLEEACYSPSTVIRDFLTAGESYRLDDFVDRSSSGLDQASRRVEAKLGFRCTSAEGQSRRLRETANRFKQEEIVTCLSIS